MLDMAVEKTRKLQDKDMTILEALQDNARLGVKQIARKTGIPITTVFNRIKNLEKNGIIKGYTAIIDKKKMGKEIEAFILINIAYTSKLHQDDFSGELRALPEVDECYIISGATNVLIKVSTRDIDTLNEFIIQNLKKRGVENISTYIIIKKKF
jgi:Lrp/AsnC family leucine-responsive transcriptional regulator